MKKAISLFIVLTTMVVFNVDAQQKDSKSKLMEGIKKEKLRHPVKLEAVGEAEKKNNLPPKNTRGTDQKVSTIAAGNQEGEAQICIDPNNPNRLVMSFMDNTAVGEIQYPVYYSGNGGSSWTKSNFNAFSKLSTDFPGYFFIGGGDPVLAYDKLGNLYFSWIYLVANSTLDTAIGAMYWAKSTDNGATFTLQPGNDHFLAKSYLDPNSPDFDAYPGSEGFYDRQWFAMDLSSGPNANTLYASFIYFNAPSESPALTGSTIKKLPSGGTAFGNKIQAISGSVQFNNVRVDNAGVLHLTGADVDNNTVLYCKSTNGGSTFSTPIPIYSGTNLFGSQGSGYIHDRENSAVNMEVDGAKNVHVVWSDFSVTPDANYKSFYSRLNNGGSSFNTPVDLTTLFVAGNKLLMPVVSTAGNRVSIGAYVINSSKVGDFYIVHSQDNGNNWSAPIKVSTLSTTFNSTSNSGAWFGDYANAVQTDTKVYNIWSDGRGSVGPKMYVNTTTLWATPTVDVTPVNSTLQLDDVYPNPVSDVLNLHFSIQKQDNIQIQLFSADSKLLLTQQYALKTGKQSVSLRMEDLASGHYILKIRNEDGFDIVRHITKN